MAGAVSGKVHSGCYGEIPHPERGQALEQPQGMVTDPEPQERLDSTLRHSVGLLALLCRARSCTLGSLRVSSNSGYSVSLRVGGEGLFPYP